jgi:membrane-bound lytic murein transglycosylase D
MWQFIAATGKVYGLDVNWWVDERRDPIKATQAAAEHLRDLYNIWGDWHLAMANYNISPRGLKRAIRNAGGVEDYWAAYPYLPRETRGYVPSFIATFIIATNPTQFGFQEEYDIEPFSYETTEITGSYQLKDLAALIDITADELKEYNPELRRWATPPGDDIYVLRIPAGTKEKFEENVDKLPKEAQKQLFVHTVARGEWLGKIANAYGVSVRDLYLSNDGLSTRIYPGQKIVIPVPEGTEVKQAGTRSSSNRYTASKSNVSQPANTAKLYYTVKPGDTIGHIAEWYNTYAWKIRSWNSTSNMIRAGQRLVIYVPNSKKSNYQGIDDLSFAKKQRLGRSGIARAEQSTVSNDGYEVYQVRRNDSLYEIARSFDVSISELRQLNDISGSRIYPGQTLKIRKK